MVQKMRKMKASGIEWIGEIPEGWEIKYFVQLFSQVKNKNVGLCEKNLLSLSYGKIKQKSIETVSGLLPANFEGYNIIDRNDIVLRLTDLQNDQHSLRVGLSHERGIITSAYCSIRVRGAESPNYLYYYLHTFDIAKGFYGMGSGVRQGLNWDGLKYIKILLPPQHEQDRISVFLNQKTLEIDSMLSKTISSIEEYKKLKQAVITQAVTKGVRGEREMKDSGVEWVSYIPVDWNTIKLKYCTYIRARLGWRALKADEYVESGFPFLSAFNIVNNALHFTNLNYINQFRYDESPEIQLKVGDVLLVKDGAGIGKCAIVENMPTPSTVNGSIAVISSTSFITPKYLYYYFLSEMFQQHIDLLKDGMGVPHLFQSDLKEIKIAFPSKDEQKEIADYLDAKCAEIDRLIAKKEQLVKELEGYKKSLIYEVVTGKREV